MPARKRPPSRLGPTPCLTDPNRNRFSLVFRVLDGVAKSYRCLHRVASRSLPDREIPALKRFHLIEIRSSVTGAVRGRR